MSWPKSSGKPRRPNAVLLVRRVRGPSMEPTLRHGRIVLAWGYPRRLAVGDVVIVRWDDREIIKRIHQLRPGEVFVLGDNAAVSTDSREFGWLSTSNIIGRVAWPKRVKNGIIPSK